MTSFGAQARILILTSGPACRNPRSLKEAITLAGAGFRVTYITVFHTEADAIEDQRLLASTPVRLLSIGARKGAKRFRQRLATWIARRLVERTPWSPSASLGPTGELLASAKQHPAELTIVHTEAAFWVGCKLMKYGRLVAADFEDWHSEDLLPKARRSRPLRLIRKLEKAILRGACFATTTSHSLSRALAESYGVTPPQVLTNSFPLQPTPAIRPLREPEMVWFSQTIGPGRGLEQFIGAWGQLSPTTGRLTLIGALSPGYNQALLDGLPASVQSRITFRNPVPSDMLPDVLAGFDIGLALERSAPPSRDLTITNKILQYLNAGLAIIATPTAGQKEVLAAAPGAGITIDMGSADAVNHLVTHLTAPDWIRSAQGASRRAAETQYNWGKEAPLLLELVGTAIARDL
jgi:glycosyltransferase involved in cell wall biosynthesis